MNAPALVPAPTLRHHPAGLSLRAPGRLHLGFLDPAGTLGRRFGSLGLVIDGFETVVEITASAHDEVSASGADAAGEIERARRHLHTLRERTGCQAPLRLHLRRVLPAHAGFGSGTQLALAVGRAFTAWHGLHVATATLASWLGRGLRSGVGIAGFDQGGLLLDGGPGAPSCQAPLMARLVLPPAWRVVVVCEPGRSGLSGTAEKQALAALPPLPQALAADLCHQVLMRVLPGAADAQFEPFAAGINRLQQVLGAHFAPAQGGQAFASTAVGSVVHWLALAAGPAGAASGQSSWGPTGFVIVPSPEIAQRLVHAAQAAAVVAPGLRLQTVRGRNQGALLQAGPAPAAGD